MAKVRVVLDANVCISALLWIGTPNQILRSVEAGDLAMVASGSMIDEIHNALMRPKFAKRIKDLSSSVSELMESLLGIVEVIQDPIVKPIIRDDPDDDKVLACAVTTRASCIVSGDTHILALKKYQDIPIFTAKEFWDTWLRNQE